jgi:hypothetical protein
MKPDLRPIPLADVLPPRPEFIYITMGRKQWDALLATAYEAGWVLLELDQQERPVRAFRRGK